MSKGAKKVDLGRNLSKIPSEIIKKIKSQRNVEKYIRDPIHDIIKIEDEVILKLLGTEPMQRLRLIKQLPFTSLVYPGADHSRFAHSLGVYHLTCLMLDKLILDKDKRKADFIYNSFVIKIAALLHDVGHGPFSHLFEDVLSKAKYKNDSLHRHENWTKKLIDEHKQISAILSKYQNLRRDVIAVINNTYTSTPLAKIVSSQFDADRFDYMLRDSYMTGVKYGRFDLNWMLRNLTLENIQKVDEDGNKEYDEDIVVDARRGLSALEEYLLGNLYLYKHVYFHKTVKAAEAMLVSVLKRAIDLLREGLKGNKKDVEVIGFKSVVLSKIAQNAPLSIDDYLKVNDNVINSWLFFWKENSKYDFILNKISSDLLNRNLYKSFDVENVSKFEYKELWSVFANILKAKNLEPEYFLLHVEPKRVAYKNLFFFRGRNELPQEIYIKDEVIKPYTSIDRDKNKVSGIIIDLKFKNEYIVFPNEVKEEFFKIIGE